MQRNMKLRYKAAMAFRRHLDELGFIDIETPMLTKSTPEGARDYLVPSRVHDGHFYALPQSPQLFKQMLMCAGFDRYYQIVKCFRDEDLRADRQPEFTQVDIETSFLNELEIRDIMENLIRHVFKETINVDLVNPFPVMLYNDAMNNYGSDKPDLRVKMKLTELTDLMTNVDFKVFKSATELRDGRVMALRVPHGASMPRAKSIATPSLSRSTVPKASPISKSMTLKPDVKVFRARFVKNISDEILQAIIERTGAQDGRRYLLRR